MLCGCSHQDRRFPAMAPLECQHVHVVFDHDVAEEVTKRHVCATQRNAPDHAIRPKIEVAVSTPRRDPRVLAFRTSALPTHENGL